MLGWSGQSYLLKPLVNIFDSISPGSSGENVLLFVTGVIVSAHVACGAVSGTGGVRIVAAPAGAVVVCAVAVD